jgi:WD40 repeat protein
MTDPEPGKLATKLDDDNPWPGPEAFRREDSKFFFGRDRARDALTRLVLQSRLVLLYGRSGLGKTSLLRAGVFPRLEDALTLPIHIRLQFGASPEPGVPPDLPLQIKAAVEAAASRANVDAPVLDPSATLWEWFYRSEAQFFNERSRRVRPVLVFDQFEEAFTHGRATPALAASTDRFLDQLIDLVRGSVPQSVAARLEQDATRVLDYVTDREACGVLLAIRQEFLAELLRLRPRLPALLDNRFELSGMTLDDAKAVVVGDGTRPVDPGVDDAIARFVAAARRNADDQTTDDTTVDPAILSIFCRELNNTRRRRQLPRITADLVAGVQEEIIADFYRRSVEDQPSSVRVFVEEQLVTPSGYRNSVAWDQAVRDAEVEKAIAALVDRRIIRVEGAPPRARIELTHDVLTEPIVQSRNLRRVREASARAREEEERARAAAANEEQRRRERAELDNKRQALQRRSATVVVLLALLIGVGVLAVKTYQAQTAAENSLSVAHVEQGLGLITTGHAARGLAYIAREVRARSENVAARSLAHDAVIHGNWALPDAVVRHKPGLSLAGVGAHDVMMLTLAGDKAVHLWNPAKPDEIRPIALDGPPITSAAIRPTDDRIATGAEDGTFRIWRDGVPRTIQAHRGAIVHLAFDAPGERLVTASVDATAAVWNAATGVRMMQLAGHKGPVQMAQFSPDGQSIVTASRDGRAIVWDIHGKQPRIRATLDHRGAVVGARFNPDGTLIVTTSDDDKVVHVWDARTGQPVGAPLEHDAVPRLAAFSPEGLRIVTVAAGEVALWTLDGFPAIEPLQFDAEIRWAAFSADGRRLVTASVDGTMTVWDVRRGAAAPNSVRAPCGLNAILKYTSDGRQVAVACPDSATIDLWDLETNELRPTESNPAWVGLSALDFNGSTGRVLAINGGQAALSHIGVAGATTLAHGSRIHATAFSPDGRLVATAGDDGTAVWDARTGASIARVARGSVSWSVHFTRDGTRIVTSSDNGFAELWDARSGRRAGPAFPATPQVRFDAQIDASGRRLVLTIPAGVTLFDAENGSKIAELHAPHLESRAVSAAFAPAGDVLVTVTMLVQLWDSATGHLLATLSEPSLPLDVRFTADGTRLVTTHESGFRFWDARTGQPQTRLVPVREYGGIASVATDGQHVVAIARDGFLRDWDFPVGVKEEGAAIASLLELMVGYRANEGGAIEPIEEWPAALAEARRTARPGGAAAWALGDRDARTINPFTSVTKDVYIRRQLATGNADALREAQRLFPWDPRLSHKGVR